MKAIGKSQCISGRLEERKALSAAFGLRVSGSEGGSLIELRSLESQRLHRSKRDDVES